MEAFEYSFRETRDLDRSAVDSSFSGSGGLRRNIVRFSRFLGLDRVLGDSFDPGAMFGASQGSVLYTQIVKCCSIGRANGLYNNSSAIYPGSVDSRIRDIYLDQSGHTECVESVFMKEICYPKPIPLVLAFSPAWQTLRRLNLVGQIPATLIDWIPHPSNPGNQVLNLLSAFEGGRDIRPYDTTASTRQIIALRKRIAETWRQ